MTDPWVIVAGVVIVAQFVSAAVQWRLFAREREGWVRERQALTERLTGVQLRPEDAPPFPREYTEDDTWEFSDPLRR